MDPATDVETLLRYKAKTVLRQRARSLRNTMPKEAIALRSAAITRALEGLSCIEKACKIALFFPMERRNEVDLRELDSKLRERDVRVAYPTIDPETKLMTFRFTRALTDLEERGSMFREPKTTMEEATKLDVIIVPALQVDPRGQRIGYGAGYYDQTLPRFAPPAKTIIVAFDFQLIAEVPITTGDVACDLIVTDKRVLAAEPTQLFTSNWPE